MKIGFIHFSDLFFGSGSAVLYRRILAEVSREHDVFHVIGLHRSMPSESEICAAYKREIPQVRPIFLPLNNALRIYYRFRNQAPFCQWLVLPGLFFRSGLRKILYREAPDFLWWSADYLPESFSTLWQMRPWLPNGILLHLSLMDPPELWPEPRKCLALYKRCLSLAHSFDCIGGHFQSRLRFETNKPVFIINDFVEQIGKVVTNVFKPGTPLRAAITGHVYGPVELQEFLIVLGQAAEQAELIWFGKPSNYAVLGQLRVPSNVSVNCPGTVSRSDIVAALQPCDFAYLSMPTALPEFARYSVPTKLVTYVESGLPVAFHAPEESEVHTLNQSFHFGVNLALAINPVDDLRRLQIDSAHYISGLQKLGRERYAKERVLRTVKELLAGVNRCKEGRLKKCGDGSSLRH